MVQTQPFLWLSLRDASGSPGALRAYVRHGRSSAGGLAAGRQLAGLVRPAAGCSVIEAAYRLPGVELQPAAPAPGADNTHVGMFIFTDATAEHYALIEVHGLRPSLLLATGPTAGLEIDTAAPAVAAFVAHIISGAYCNRFGHVLAQLAGAYLQRRK